MRKIIQLGESLRLYTDYFDLDTSAAIDPTLLTFTLKRPDNTVETYTYPHTNIVRVAPGEYFIRYLSDQIGTHSYNLFAQLNVDESDVRVGKFDVEPVL